MEIRPIATLEVAAQADFYRVKATESLANRWLAAVTATTRTLRTSPGRGNLFPSTRPTLQGIRRISVEGFPNHFLFYRVTAATRTVIVMRMLHGVRDLESLL